MIQERHAANPASVPGVSVTAMATPEVVSWSTGDGGTVRVTARAPYSRGEETPDEPS
jgi:hypothetical protein